MIIKEILNNRLFEDFPVSIEEASTLLGVNSRTLTRWIKDPELNIKTYVYKRRYMIPCFELARLISRGLAGTGKSQLMALKRVQKRNELYRNAIIGAPSGEL